MIKRVTAVAVVLCLLYVVDAQISVDTNTWYINQYFPFDHQTLWLAPFNDTVKTTGILFQVYTEINSIDGDFLCVQIIQLEPHAPNTYTCYQNTVNNALCLGHLGLSIYSGVNTLQVVTCCSFDGINCAAHCNTSGVNYNIYFQYIEGDNATEDCNSSIPPPYSPPSVSASPKPVSSATTFPSQNLTESPSSDLEWIFIIGGLIGLVLLAAVIGAGAYFHVKKLRGSEAI